MSYLLAFCAGIFAILQVGMNKNISQQWGFIATVLIGACVYLLSNLLFLVITHYRPHWFPAEYLAQGSWSNFKIYWLLPGFLGFCLVLGLTISLSQIGAVPTFLISIAAQVIGSALWDYFMDGRPLTTIKIAGALLTVAGVVLSTR